MKPELQFNALHDARLTNMCIDWEKHTAEVHFSTSNYPAMILCTSLKSINLSDGAPWGKSAMINEVTLVENSDATKNLKIEIQSGDVLQITAGGISLSYTD